MVVDEVVQGWRRFGLRLITGLFWLIVDLFRRLLQIIERLMYSVDEWLRFRSGQGRVALIAKAGMGFLWFFVAYVLRFAVNVLLEPQINPIKHFPVVTVGHKLLLAAYKPAADFLIGWLGINKIEAYAIGGTVIWCIPGIFGFLVWELTANWRLYAANRPQRLRPVKIGSHGETMIRLLRPGFHSGTVPKRYAKLRRAERHARAGGDWGAVPQALAGSAQRRVVDPPLRRSRVSRTAAGKQVLAGPDRHPRTDSAEHELRAIVAGVRGDGGRALAGRHRFAVGLARGRHARPRLDRPASGTAAAGAGHRDPRPLQSGGNRADSPAD